MPTDWPSIRNILALSGRAILAQLILGAPFGLADFSTVLEKTGQPLLAWGVAIAFGCYRAIGVPIVLGGALVGATERPDRLWAVAIAGLPTALLVGGYLPRLLGSGFSPGRTLGGIGALWLLGTLVGLVGYGLGRIFRHTRKQVES